MADNVQAAVCEVCGGSLFYEKDANIVIPMRSIIQQKIQT